MAQQLQHNNNIANANQSPRHRVSLPLSDRDKMPQKELLAGPWRRKPTTARAVHRCSTPMREDNSACLCFSLCESSSATPRWHTVTQRTYPHPCSASTKSILHCVRPSTLSFILSFTEYGSHARFGLSCPVSCSDRALILVGFAGYLSRGLFN